MPNKNMKRIYAIQAKYKKEILKVNPNINNRSGIYFLTRTDENGIKFYYIGQSVDLLARMISHMMGYQHIDLSLRKRGFWSPENPFGWKLGFLNYPESKLDEMEQKWILEYMKNGYQARYNKTAGGQGVGKEKINEYRPSKGYRDGIQQGKITLAREIKHIVDLHLMISLRKDTKIAQKQLEKFWELINEENYK